MGGPVGQGRPGDAPWRARCRSCGWPARRWAAGCWPERARGAEPSSRRRDGDPAFLEAKLVTARFYAEVILPPALAQLGPIKARRPHGVRADGGPALSRRPDRAAGGRGRGLRPALRPGGARAGVPRRSLPLLSRAAPLRAAEAPARRQRVPVALRRRRGVLPRRPHAAPTRRPSSVPSSASARRSTAITRPAWCSTIRPCTRGCASCWPRPSRRARWRRCSRASRRWSTGCWPSMPRRAAWTWSRTSPFGLPVEVICDMLGVPPGERAPFRALFARHPGRARAGGRPRAPGRGQRRGRRVLGLSRRARGRTAQAAGRRSRCAGHADPRRGRRRAADARRAGAELHLPAERRPRDRRPT